MTQTPEQLAALLPMLGIKLTPEELEQRVVDQIVSCILDQEVGDINLDEEWDSEGYQRASYEGRMRHKVVKAIQTRIDKSIASYLDEHLSKNFETMVRSILFPRTNGYGEKKAEPETFLEHFERQAREYMAQRVNYNGETVANSYDRGSPRLVWMLEKQFRADMQTAITKALKDVGTEMGKQLQATVAACVQSVKVHT